MRKAATAVRPLVARAAAVVESSSSPGGVRALSSNRHRPIPKRGAKVARVLPIPVQRKQLADWKEQQAALKFEQRQHYFETGTWKKLPVIPKPSNVRHYVEPPPSPVLTPLARPYPGYVRVDHPHPLNSYGPFLPTGISVPQMREYITARQAAARQAAASATAAQAAVDEAVDGAPTLHEPVTTEAVIEGEESKRAAASAVSGEDAQRAEDAGALLAGRKAYAVGSERDVLQEELTSAGAVFAIVVINGRQFKVMKHDQIMVDRLPGANVGDHLAFDRVLLTGTRDHTLVGLPAVEGARVTAVVEEHTKTARTLVFHKIRRKGYRNTSGHRDSVTIMRVTDVVEPTAEAPRTTQFPTNLSPELPLPRKARA